MTMLDEALRNELGEAADRLAEGDGDLQATMRSGRRRRRTVPAAFALLAAVVLIGSVAAGSQFAGDRDAPPLSEGRGAEDVAVFLCTGEICPEPSPTTKNDLLARLEDDPAVADVRFESREDAYERFVEHFSDQRELVQSVSPEDLPASFRVTLDPATDAETFADALRGTEGVENVIVLDGEDG